MNSAASILILLSILILVSCVLYIRSIFLLLQMVKNKKVTINNTKFLLDSTSNYTNYNDIYNDNYMYNYIYKNEHYDNY